MAISKITTKGIADDSVTSAKLAAGAVTINDIPDGEITMAKLSQVDLSIAPEVLEIQVDAPASGQDTAWLWTWEQSTLPYARRTITNSPEISVPLYRQGTYTVNNYAAYSLHGSMTQTHTLYFKWIDGAGTDNLVSWATSTGPVSDSHPDINGGAATQVQRINISVPATVTPPALTPPSVSYSVTNNGTGAYTFTGSASGDNPNIGPFYRGGTYTINITATGHPFYFTTDNGTNFSSGTYFGEYTSGVTGSRTDNGTITFTVPNDAPATLYYQCGNHSVMRGAITVKDLAVETNVNGNYVIYAQHTQEGHKTPVEIRPIPSLVNQMCLVYDANSGKFVPQDLATYVENTPSFENKIREVAGTAELVVEDGSAVIAKVNVYDDSTYLPLVGNNPGDQAFATDTDILYIWDGSAWQQAGAANTDDLSEGTTNLFYTDARVGTYLTANGYLNSETNTSIALNGNSLDYTDEQGNTTNISLAGFLDDTTNTVVSASLSGNTITFTREDATTFALDVSSLSPDFAMSDTEVPVGQTLTIPVGRQLVVDHLDVSGSLDIQGTISTVSGGSISNTTMKTAVIQHPIQGSGLTINEVVTATGFIGDGSQLTGVSSYTDSDTANYLANNAVTIGGLLTLTNGSDDGGDIKAGTLSPALKIDTGAIWIAHDETCILFDEGQKAITSNDNGGNLHIRSGSDDEQLHMDSTSGSSGIAILTMNTDGTGGQVSLGAGPIRTAGSSADFTQALTIDENGIWVHAPNNNQSYNGASGTVKQIAKGDRPYGDYIVKAYASFNMNNSGSIYSSANCSSVTITGTGYAKLNFAIAMPNTDYTVVGDANAHGDGGNAGGLDAGAYSTATGAPSNQPGTTSWVSYDYRDSGSTNINKRYATMVVFGQG